MEPPKSPTEWLAESNPDQYREYLFWEDALCSPFSQTHIPPRELERAEYKLDQLFRFFRFELTRQKYGTWHHTPRSK